MPSPSLSPSWPPPKATSPSITPLPNGLDILLRVDRKVPIVHVNLRIRAGSKHEKPGQYGLAHLVEHLFYEDRDGNPLSNQLERLGATNFCGDLNGDFTEFCATIPSGRLESYLWAQSNPFALFLQNLTQRNLDNQREVVINERRQRLENEPYHLLGPILAGATLPARTPLPSRRARFRRGSPGRHTRPCPRLLR